MIEDLIVVKRDGKKVSFDGAKIAIAIKKGFDSIDGKYNEDDIAKIYGKVIQSIEKLNVDKIKIEKIQDLIELELKENGYNDVYNSFAEYREKRAQSREIFFEEKRKHKFLKALEKLGLRTKENADIIVDTKNAMQTMEAYGKTVSSEFTTSYLIKKKFSEAHENGDIFINNLEFYPMGTTENCQINLEKLFDEGFRAENSSMREPQNIIAYAMLTAIAISENQKDQNGVQSIPALDYYMSPGVLRTFKKEFRQTIYDILEYSDYDKFIAINGIEREIDKLSTIDFDIELFYKFTRGAESLKRMFRFVYDNALEKTKKLTFQAMEAFIHNLNSICNSKITTINLGTDSSAEGRMITENILLAVEEGVGENKEAVSPIIVFKIKSGVNYEENTINHDLLVKACKLVKENKKITFSILDSNFNASFYKEGDFNTEVGYFGDGSRVIDNFVDADKEISSGRGVISSTVINLPRIALKHKDNIDDFWIELDQKMDIVKEQLLERLEVQGNKKVSNFPFLMKENVWIDSEKLKEDDRIKKILKQGTLKISFVGLNECLIVMTGKNHADSRKSQELGIKIVTRMREKADEYSKKYNLNFVLAGGNDETIAKDFMEFDRVIFGKIEGVTNKGGYTNSFELPAEYDEEMKIKIEAPYHELTNGGHITEVYSTDIFETIKNLYKNEIRICSNSFKIKKNTKDIKNLKKMVDTN